MADPASHPRDTMSPRIGLLGAAGRMGRAIAEAAAAQGVVLVGGIDRAGAVFGGAADPAGLAAACDVLIDFSSPDALAAHLTAAQAAGVAIVVGTTGLGRDHHALIDAAAATIPVLQAANTALGVTVLAWLVREAAARLGPDWDIEVVEMHHRHKRDAPSGTALLLGAAAADGRGEPLDTLARHDRNGVRDVGTIGFASLRGGSVAGDHQIVFATEGERIELGHRAESRAIFARGALRAASWLAGRGPGRYAMSDIFAG